jgi:hypothetical protein
MLHGGHISEFGYAVQAGAAIVFTDPASVIHAGDVCAFGALTGKYGIDYEFTIGTYGHVNYAMAPEDKDSDSNLVTSVHCDPTTEMVGDFHQSLYYILKKKLDLPDLQDSALPLVRNKAHYTVIDAEMGGKTFYPGIYFASSLTMATNTKVYLKGNGKFTFISGSTMVTGANTEILLVPYDPENDVEECGDPDHGYHATNCTVHDVIDEDDTTTTGVAAEFSGRPAPANIEWVVTAAATLGSLSEFEGSILAGAAITLGEQAKVSGVILALAGVTLGSECEINKASVRSASMLDTYP